ncbi:SET and MYND domain-containing protein 5 [Acipenser ruthenus]|uniref:Protein-lysine N-trimethyltransferase SMYD5 n=1 Tax=Acipenser ruthenus TaxID=7906 RepID=A0A444UN05_ACIRT|nr:SET and MYND domain-containing protein 5 [Acipenser ruthenus]
MAAPISDMFSFCVDPGRISSSVEVRLIDKIKGKGLFAKRTIRKGETIFVERPLVSAQFLWNALYKYRACDYCLRSLETAEENGRRLSGNPCLSLPHPEQCRVRRELHEACPQCQYFVSRQCSGALQAYLVILPDSLPRLSVCLFLRNMHYPPETSSIMLMARMVATVKQARDKGHWLSLFSQFCSRTANEEEEIAHKLLGEKFQGQLGVLKQLFTKALYDEHLCSWFTLEGFRSLFALVGTNGQGVGTSSLSQWVHGCDSLELRAREREQLDAFIDQLYKDIEKGNHSCIPNAEASFPENNFLLHLTALSDIKPGEEICISYLDCCQRDRSRHSRHKILRENYLFVCSCPKCVSQAEELDVTSEEEEEEEEEEEGEGDGETEGDDLEDEMTDV